MNQIGEIKLVDNPGKKFSTLEICSPNVSQLYIRGSHPELLTDQFIGKRIGIVGTRGATQAGLNDARKISQVVCENGGIVVSGMALGIDGAAHRGALDVGGKTIAVLGSGVDVIYPMRHETMSVEIMKNGCIISEFDCRTKALPWHFPVRNRIIAALSDVLVVPEGTLRGGARITVDLALAMGKTICAIPGPRRNRASELPNSIIKDGAVVVLDPADVVREFGIDSDDFGWELSTSQQVKKTVATNTNFDKILSELAHGPLTCVEISRLCKYSEKEAMRLLCKMEELGQVRFKRGMYEFL